MRRKERDRRVAPVVDLARRAILGIELEHRQQFDGGDAELLEIGDLLDQAGIGAARLLGNAGTGMAGEAAHVHLVDDGPRGGPAAAAHRLPNRTSRGSTTTLFIAVAALSPASLAASRL